MLAISCNFNDNLFFHNMEKQRPQRHMSYCFKNNIENEDPKAIGAACALLTCVMSSYGYSFDSLSEVMFYNAKNKNITKTVKTDMKERILPYNDIIEKIKNIISSDDETFNKDQEIVHSLFVEDWGGWSGLTAFFSSFIASSDGKLASFPSNYLPQITKAIGQFNKISSGEIYESNSYCICPMPDRTYFNIKLALDTTIYDSIKRFDASNL